MISIQISQNYSQIIKLLRYRTLSHRIHMGFTIDSPVIDINEVQRVLKKHSANCLLYKPLNKMHDMLPLTFFVIEFLCNKGLQCRESKFFNNDNPFIKDKYSSFKYLKNFAPHYVKLPKKQVKLGIIYL